MDTEAYLLARREIQDRLDARRLRLFTEPGANGSRAGPSSWWPVVERWLVRDTGWQGLLSGIVTAGAGYALSRLRKAYDF